MSKKIFTVAFLFVSLIVFRAEASAAPAQNEKLVTTSLRLIHSAQVTYAATAGNGDYAPLFSSLREAGLIDEALATAYKYGYSYQMFAVPHGGNMPATFYVVARPISYRKSGVKSFYIDQTGVLRGGDKQGAAATATDFIIDTDCVPYEECAISSLRDLYGAEITYAATVGNGNYASFQQLYDANLISRVLWIGTRGGYTFQYSTIAAVPGTSPAFFSLKATPVRYDSGSRRSFYIDLTGVLRGADKNGAPATSNDPPIQ